MTVTSSAPRRIRTRSTWPRWIGPAAAAWSAAYGILGLLWSAGGPGFPFGRAHDPDGKIISILDAVTPRAAAPVIAVLGLGGAVLAVLVSRIRARTAPGPAAVGPASVGPAAIGLAWLYAAGLTLVLPDYRPLIRVAYTPVFVIGKIGFGWPAGVGFGDPYTWPVLNQVLCMGGGLLFAGTALVATRRLRRGCAGCGRTESGSPAVRWGRTAVRVAVAVPLLYSLVRWAWALGIPLGVSREFLRAGDAENPGIWLMGAMLGSLAAGGAVLTLGLARPWGEIYPRWIPGLRGKPVRPRTAIIPATLVAILVTTAGLMHVRLAVLGQLPGGFAENIATVGPALLWPLWGAALGAATYAYHLRRRGLCQSCGRR